mgnify:CR=1 FL=1
MSWSRYSKNMIWYSIFKGLWTREPVGDIPTDPKKNETYLAQATNVYAPGISTVLRKRPGFTQVRSTAINASGIFTSLVHQGEIADRMLMTVSIAGTSHNIYQDSANPPAAIAGGTNFTIGADNLVDYGHFTDGTNPGTILISRLRNLPQFINASGTRSNFTIAGTGLTSLLPSIMEIFGQRALYGNCDNDGTVFDDRVYWSAVRDGNAVTDDTTDFESFETKDKDRVRAIRKISDICMVGKLNNVFTLILTPEASRPFSIQEEPGGRLKGPVSQQACLEADQRLYWLGQTGIHSLDSRFQIKDWADQIAPTIEGLNDTDRREFSIAGYDPHSNIIQFCVSDGTDTTHKTVIALNIKTGAIYIWTDSRNAYGYRFVSDEHRLIGGGYTGFFYNEMQTGSDGNLDDATAVIDADVFTPRFWLNAYGHKQKVPLIYLSVDPIGSESLTVQFRLDDSTQWSDPTGSPYAVSGTDHDMLLVPIRAWAERIQLRFRNNTASAVYSVKAVGIPSAVPTLVPA